MVDLNALRLKKSSVEDQEEMTTAQRDLRLLSSGSIRNSKMREQLLRRCIDELFGAESKIAKSFNDSERIAVEGEEFDQLVFDLQKYAATPAIFGPNLVNDAARSDDDILKDRISRVFMSSSAFSVCKWVLGVGTILFGVNLGFLSFDTTFITKQRNEAATAVTSLQQAAADAQAQARLASSQIAAVIDQVKFKLQADIPAQAIKSLDIPQIQAHVVSGLTDILQPRIDKLNDNIHQIGENVDKKNEALDLLKASVGKAQAKADAAEKRANDALGLFDRWKSAVDVAQKTTLDQTFAKTIWFILRQDAVMLISSCFLSASALLLAIFALKRKRAHQ